MSSYKHSFLILPCIMTCSLEHTLVPVNVHLLTFDLTIPVEVPLFTMQLHWLGWREMYPHCLLWDGNGVHFLLCGSCGVMVA